MTKKPYEKPTAIRVSKKDYYTDLKIRYYESQLNKNKPNKKENPPIVEKSFLLKWCIVLILLMVILTYNTIGGIQIRGDVPERVHEDTEVIYTTSYKKATFDENTAMLNRFLNSASAVSQFGRDNTWVKLVNSISNVNDFSSSIELIGTLLLMPINIGIDLFCLVANIYNSWIGIDLIKTPNFVYTRAVKNSLFGVPLFKYIWNQIFD